MIFLPAIPLFYFMSITVKILSWHSISTWTISKRNQLREKKGYLKTTDCMKYKNPFRFHLEMHFFWSGLWSEAFISHFQFKWHWYRYNQVIFTNRAVFKWLSKVIPWLRLLRLVIGLKDSRQFFNQWDAKPNQNYHVHVIFPALRASYMYLLGIVIGSSRCLLLLWLVGVIALVLVFRQSFENPSTWKKKVFRDNSTMTLSWSTALRKLQYIIACLH